VSARKSTTKGGVQSVWRGGWRYTRETRVERPENTRDERRETEVKREEKRAGRLTFVTAVLQASTMTTSSAELINIFARPRDGSEEVNEARAEDMVVIASDSSGSDGSEEDDDDDDSTCSMVVHLSIVGSLLMNLDSVIQTRPPRARPSNRLSRGTANVSRDRIRESTVSVASGSFEESIYPFPIAKRIIGDQRIGHDGYIYNCQLNPHRWDEW
jgi:hypothetical protein